MSQINVLQKAPRQTAPGKRPGVFNLHKIQDSFTQSSKDQPIYTHKPEPAAVEPLHPGLRQVMVMPGDTVNGMLLRQGLKFREIQVHRLIYLTYEMNGLEENSTLRIGQTLILPTRSFVVEQMAC